MSKTSIAVLCIALLLAAGVLIWLSANYNDTFRGIKLAIRLPSHREALVAQCPPVHALSNEDALALPINLTHWGQSNSRMVIIHGGVQGNLGGGPTTFAKQEALAQQGWHLILPDRPGFGKSPSRGPDNMEADAIWISNLLDGVVLVGHSFGGAEALLAAAQRPESVRALVLVEPALHALLPRSEALEKNEEARRDFLKFGEASLASNSPTEYGLLFARNLGAGTEAGAALDSDPGKAKSLGCALLRARMAPPETLRKAAETVAQAKIPVLIISGGWSPTFDAIGELAASLTGGKHVIVPSPNHFPQLANPEIFNSTILSFANENGIGPHIAAGTKQTEHPD
jgi:pimeloyl-ACP methyl ester carboxylesterase